jgi:hypothetical protein
MGERAPDTHALPLEDFLAVRVTKPVGVAIKRRALIEQRELSSLLRELVVIGCRHYGINTDPTAL